MVLDILRHGIADERRAGLADAQRQLTEEGRAKLKRVLERARAAGVKPSLILTSPLVRAFQTAEMAAVELKCRCEIAQTPALGPAATAAETWSELRQYADADEVLLVGHEPHLGKFAAYVLGVPSLNIDFKKAAIVRVRVEPVGRSPRGTLEWMLTPALAK